MLSTVVHFVFDLTVYNLLLDILNILQFNSDDFKFDIAKVNNREKLKAKIIFNVTLLSISYISSVQFVSIFSSFFMYILQKLLIYPIFEGNIRNRN